MVRILLMWQCAIKTRSSIMNDNTRAPAHSHDSAAEIIPGQDATASKTKDASTDADNKGHNGNPAQSAGRVTAQEQDDAPDATVDFEGKEAKHLSPESETGKHS
jgi:hypothetical protein